MPAAQTICRDTIEDIEAFIRVFDSVTTRASWVDRMLRQLPPVGQKRREVCLFSAWDFHIPPCSPKCWQLIEFNDNGSGFMFAARINRCFYELAGLEADRSIAATLQLPEFGHRLLKMVEQEARGFHDDIPDDLFLILDDTEFLEAGKFRREHLLLRELLRQWGTIGAPEDLKWTGEELLYRGTPVSFIINRSTDCFGSERRSRPCASHIEEVTSMLPRTPIRTRREATSACFRSSPNLSGTTSSASRPRSAQS